VNYAGLPDHADHALVKKYMGGKCLGHHQLWPEGRAMAWKAGGKFQDALKLFTRLGQHRRCQVTGLPPCVSTTHRQLNAAELKPRPASSLDMVRLSVGIEHIDDLLEDLEQALAAV
jgi:O-acetylhomoserine (thiol)-lyase